jgi:hypothetical protein
MSTNHHELPVDLPKSPTGRRRKKRAADSQVAVPKAGALSLSPADQRHLDQFENKLQLVRDRTTGVARRFSTGFFLHGPGGVSKTYTVIAELQRLQANHRLSNARMTGRGLFDTLKSYPDAVHVIEDAEPMMRDGNALGVLRSALWGQRRDGEKGPSERRVTWSAYKTRLEILFTGGVIVISNRDLLDTPELQALRTRIPCMHLQPTDAELGALMRHIALRGFEHEGHKMDPAECREVCEHVLAESLSLHRPLDMRLLINSFSAYLQWQEGEAGCHWQDLVAATIRERATAFRAPVSRLPMAERKQQEQQIAREIDAATENRAERLRLWQKRTDGKSESALYRRMDELRHSDSHFGEK